MFLTNAVAAGLIKRTICEWAVIVSTLWFSLHVRTHLTSTRCAQKLRFSFLRKAENVSDVNKDWTHKEKDKDKDQAFKDKDKDKDVPYKDKDQDKDLT